jgi:hypothetical protein
MAKEHVHTIMTGRKPGTQKCTSCSWRFPCPEATCAHLDCIEFKGELPRCYYCEKRVEGPIHGTWTPWNVRNHTRAVHYCCRDACADLEDLGRWDTKASDITCKHEYEGKLRG